MEVKGMTPDQLRAVVDQVSRDHYGGNIMVDWERSSPRLLNQRGTRFRGRVLARSSRGPGARRSWSGRRLTAACWHVFRDVIREALRQYPDAAFRTSMARYTAANFEDTYPATGYRNVGSMMCPVTMPELCDHSDDAGWVPEPVRERRERPTPPVPRPTDEQLWAARLDAILGITPGRCGWCHKSTGSDASMWCTEECHDAWQGKYAVS